MSRGGYNRIQKKEITQIEIPGKIALPNKVDQGGFDDSVKSYRAITIQNGNNDDVMNRALHVKSLL